MKKEELSKEKQIEYDKIFEQMRNEIEQVPEEPMLPRGIYKLDGGGGSDKIRREIVEKYRIKLLKLFEE